MLRKHSLGPRRGCATVLCIPAPILSDIFVFARPSGDNINSRFVEDCRAEAISCLWLVSKVFYNQPDGWRWLIHFARRAVSTQAPMWASGFNWAATIESVPQPPIRPRPARPRSLIRPLSGYSDYYSYISRRIIANTFFVKKGPVAKVERRYKHVDLRGCVCCSAVVWCGLLVGLSRTDTGDSNIFKFDYPTHQHSCFICILS